MQLMQQSKYFVQCFCHNYMVEEGKCALNFRFWYCTGYKLIYSSTILHCMLTVMLNTLTVCTGSTCCKPNYRQNCYTNKILQRHIQLAYIVYDSGGNAIDQFHFGVVTRLVLTAHLGCCVHILFTFTIYYPKLNSCHAGH